MGLMGMDLETDVDYITINQACKVLNLDKAQLKRLEEQEKLTIERDIVTFARYCLASEVAAVKKAIKHGKLEVE
ncbi:MAG: queuine/archaeosine tRNA-ribosyltransferase [Candidatus Marinamargulisbacteria bacterium]|jgi:queuine/archaeosine tRNA-ribosyltransferase